MNNILKATALAVFAFLFTITLQAQSTEITGQNKQKEKETPVYKSKTEKNVEESLERAADAASRAAEKLKIVIEDKAGKIAKSSQPLIENFLVATSNLIEKLAAEIEKMVDEKSVKKGPAK